MCLFKKINKFCFEQHIFPKVIITFIIKINGDRKDSFNGLCIETNISRTKKIYILIQ